jgi:hypothetical protein
MKPTLDEEITEIAQKAQIHVYDTDRKKQMVKEIKSAIYAGIEAWRRQEPPNEVLALMSGYPLEEIGPHVREQLLGRYVAMMSALLRTSEEDA